MRNGGAGRRRVPSPSPTVAGTAEARAGGQLALSAPTDRPAILVASTTNTDAVTASHSATAVLGGSRTMPGPEWIWVLVVIVVLVAAVMAVLRLARRR